MSQIWLTVGIPAVIAVIILVWLFNRYYYKAGHDTALVRNGFGGHKVLVDGGCLAWPFLHSVVQIPLKSIAVTVTFTGAEAVLTADRIRADLSIEFSLRVHDDPDDVIRASRGIGARAINETDLAELMRGRLTDATSLAAAAVKLTDIHDQRVQFAASVRERLEPGLAVLGLVIDGVSIISFNQSAVMDGGADNAFVAEGQRRLAEMVSENRKRRAEIEAQADIAVRESELQRLRKQSEIDRQTQTAEIELQNSISTLQAESETTRAKAAEAAAGATATARIERENVVREAEIERDMALRRRELEALQATESAKIDSQIALSKKRLSEIAAEAQVEDGQVAVVRAREAVTGERERLQAERERKVALINANRDTDVETHKNTTGAAILLENTDAEAKASEIKAKARAGEMAAEAEGKRAMLAAENSMDDRVIAMSLELERLRTIPQVAEKIARPLEKIEGIRINHIGGLGGARGDGSQPVSPFAEAMENILAMSVQLPAMKKLGEEIGLDMDVNLATRATDALARSSAGKSAKTGGTDGGGRTVPANKRSS